MNSSGPLADHIKRLNEPRAIADCKFADETVVDAAQLMTPEWANVMGNVHGGAVLSLVDNVAFVCACRYAGGLCVTASVDRVDFLQPIHVGELLKLEARICYVGRTSVDVEINIFAEDIPTGNVRHTNTCHLTMVAMRDGKPAGVPPLVCRTREDKARYIQARMRRETGRKFQIEQNEFLKGFAELDDEELDALIAEGV